MKRVVCGDKATERAETGVQKKIIKYWFTTAVCAVNPPIFFSLPCNQVEGSRGSSITNEQRHYKHYA